MKSLPEFGFVRLSQIIGRIEVTKEQAAENRAAGRGRQKPCSGLTAIIPVSSSAWWRGIRSGHFPKPIKQGKSTLWNVADIRALVKSMALAENSAAEGDE